MQLKCGDDFDEAIAKACQQNNPKHVYLQTCELLERKQIALTMQNMQLSEQTNCIQRCAKIKNSVAKKAWTAHLSCLVKRGHHQDAHALLKRALTSLLVVISH